MTLGRVQFARACAMGEKDVVGPWRLSTVQNKVASYLVYYPPAGQQRTLWNRPVPPRSRQYVSCLPDAKGGNAWHGGFFF